MTYHYAVRAVNAGGETGDWSEYASAVAGSTPAPTLTAQATANGIELSWTAVSDAVRFELWSWTSTDGWQQLGDDGLTGTTYVHGDAAAGTTYYYTVRSANAAGETSAWAQNVSATAPPQQPEDPQHTDTPTNTPHKHAHNHTFIDTDGHAYAAAAATVLAATTGGPATHKHADIHAHSHTFIDTDGHAYTAAFRAATAAGPATHGYADIHAHSYAYAYTDEHADKYTHSHSHTALCSVAVDIGNREQSDDDLVGSDRRLALRAVGVGQRPRRAADRRKQSDRYDLQTYRPRCWQDVPLRRPLSGRHRSEERMVIVYLCTDSFAHGHADKHADSHTHTGAPATAARADGHANRHSHADRDRHTYGHDENDNRM